MTTRLRATVFGICFLVIASQAVPQERDKAKPFRTDTDGPYTAAELKQLNGKNRDQVLQWYELPDGDFPPKGAAHAISGELIFVDHLERRFHLRVDRNDSQSRAVWDLPLDAYMLPYGSIRHLGSPAALQDIPLGTHLHGEFFLRKPDDDTPPPDAQHNRETPEIDFRRCLSLEDDFSHHARLGQLWHVDSIDLNSMKLVATLHQDGEAVGKPKTFDLLTHTRVWEKQGFTDLKAIQPGQTVLFNLTWVTLYGPGRITEIWLDDEARRHAAAHQLERHRNHVRERGLAGWVTEVDDEKEVVTVLFFGGVDPTLLAEIEPKSSDDTPAGRPGLAVARDTLMTYDPVNDRKRGDILDVTKRPAELGSSGVQVRLKMDMLLEGYRPKRVVRLYPAHWPVQALPREEQFFGRE